MCTQGTDVASACTLLYLEMQIYNSIRDVTEFELGLCFVFVIIMIVIECHDICWRQCIAGEIIFWTYERTRVTLCAPSVTNVMSPLYKVNELFNYLSCFRIVNFPEEKKTHCLTMFNNTSQKPKKYFSNERKD